MHTLADPLEHARRHHAQRTAVIDGDEHLSYAQLYDRAMRLAGALLKAGLKPGDRVALLAFNGHRFFEAFLGLPAAGLVLVPLNTRLAVAELEGIVVHSGARMLLSDRDPGVLASRVERTIAIPDEYEQLIASAEPAPAAALDESALAALFYTGGTTGHSKGVMLTHRNLTANAFHKTVACSLTGDDIFLAAPAMFHVAGIAPLVSLVWLGGCSVTLPSFDPAACLDLIEKHRITVFMPVPTMLAALVAEQRRQPRDVSSLRMLGHAGSPIATDLIRSARETFPNAELAQFYGATETASIVTCLRHEEDVIDTPLLGTCGRAVAGVAVRIMRPDGTECDLGEVGEICVRGPNVTVGYWNDPEITAAALVDGWYRTGDMGLMRDHGMLFVVDRIKDMIISGGENVYSVEVEDALAKHPAVLEAAVFGIPHPEWGEAVHAVVMARDADAADPEALAAALRQHCRESIAGYKVPKTIEVRREPLPKSGPGKILKRVLRDPHWQGRERVIG